MFDFSVEKALKPPFVWSSRTVPTSASWVRVTQW